MMNKKELRQYIRQEKRRFSQQQLREMSLSLIHKVLSHPRIQTADTVIMYHSLPDEVYTHEAIDVLVGRGKTVLLPVVVSDTDMVMKEYVSGNLADGSLGVMEPLSDDTDAYVPDDAIIVVPGMAFDTHGHRLGRGKGYYDRFFSQYPSLYKIGVCFPFQLVGNVPTEPTDVTMDEVVCL